jgi:6-phospho-3-hexuloisomerase
LKQDQMDFGFDYVLKELSDCLHGVSTDSLWQTADLIDASARIFIGGAGRSGLCMRAFGMRLMHLGKTVYVTGEVTTPRIAAHDLLILGSGSGRTVSLIKMAEIARRCGAEVLLFTTDSTSPLAELANFMVVIPAPSYMDTKKTENLTSTQPLGSLFEQSMFIIGDSLIRVLIKKMGVGAEQMYERHANLE